MPSVLFMRTVPVELPESLHKDIEALARKEGYSMNQFLAAAASEKVAVMTTLAYLKQEAAAGNREDFDRFLAAVPAPEPLDSDRIP